MYWQGFGSKPAHGSPFAGFELIAPADVSPSNERLRMRPNSKGPIHLLVRLSLGIANPDSSHGDWPSGIPCAAIR
jgi:hypothetical protein